MPILRTAKMCRTSSRCVWRTCGATEPSAQTRFGCVKAQAHVPRVQRLHAEHLHHAARTRMVVVGRKDELRALLFGGPLSRRENELEGRESLRADLDACLRGVMVLLAEEVGECDALGQARLEWMRIVSMEADYAGIACKRAALLFALHREPAVRAEFADSDPELIADLRDRVLPMTIPSFVAGMGQAPEALVVLVQTLCELWPGEAMGMETHMHEPVCALDDRGDGEGGRATA